MADRRFGTPLILSFLLLLGTAGGLAWLHFTDRLAPLIASGPSIEVELPSAISATEPEPAERDDASAGDGTAISESAAPARSGDAPAGEAELDSSASEAAPEAEAELAPAPDAAPPESAAEAPEPPDTAMSEPVAPDDTAGEAPGDTVGEAAPEAAAEAPVPEAPVPEASVPEASVPPPPAPPAPEIAESEDGVAGSAEPAADATPEADAETETPSGAATAPQVATAIVPPGVVPAWQRFARPFPADETRPRIAVVVAGLGLSEAATTAAIQQLPAEITLSFSPYSNRIEEWVAMAQAAGHEVMIDLPMEPASFPRDDPGPQALLTSLSDGTNAERLEWILGRADGYVGVASYMGSRFTTSSSHMRPVLEALAGRGLMFLDSRAAADSLAAALAGELGVTHAINDRFLDNEASRVAIDGRLQQIERIARTRGVAVAMGYAYPVTIERLTRWTKSLAGKGLALAPISAVADMQGDR